MTGWICFLAKLRAGLSQLSPSFKDTHVSAQIYQSANKNVRIVGKKRTFECVCLFQQNQRSFVQYSCAYWKITNLECPAGENICEKLQLKQSAGCVAMASSLACHFCRTAKKWLRNAVKKRMPFCYFKIYRDLNNQLLFHNEDVLSDKKITMPVFAVVDVVILENIPMVRKKHRSEMLILRLINIFFERCLPSVRQD